MTNRLLFELDFDLYEFELCCTVFIFVCWNVGHIAINRVRLRHHDALSIDLAFDRDFDVYSRNDVVGGKEVLIRFVQRLYASVYVCARAHARSPLTWSGFDVMLLRMPAPL